MFKIIRKEELAKGIKLLEIYAPLISRKIQPGQFIVIVVDEKGERIPLTVVDTDKKGYITIIFQEVGFTTRKLACLNAGESIAHILGPLGHPTEIKNYNTCICIGGGVGIAELYPVTSALKNIGNKIIGIMGARSRELLILEDKMKSVCDELHITTDDGSYKIKGFVTDVLKEILTAFSNKSQIKQIGLVYTIGPVPMMAAVSGITKTYKIKTTVSLNPIMVDATGMCGACRLRIEDKTVFGCVDGPEFDGHKVDFRQLQARLNLFREQEKKAENAQ